MTENSIQISIFTFRMRHLIIIFSLITVSFYSFSQDTQRELVESISYSLNNDYAAVDSIIALNGDKVVHLDQDEKLEFLLNELSYYLTSNTYDSALFQNRLIKYKVINLDRNMLLLLGTALNDNEIITGLDKVNNELIQGADRKAIYFALKGYSETENSSVTLFFEKALKHAKAAQIPTIPSLVLNIISTKYKSLGNYKKAVEYYQKGIENANAKDLHLCVSHFSIALAEIQIEMDNLKKAKLFYEQASSIAERLRNNWHLATSLRGLGNIQLEERDYDLGVVSFQRALVLYYQIASDIGVAQTHKDIGRAYLLKSDLDIAERNFQLSRTFYDKLILAENGEDQLYYYFAKLRFKQGKFRSALTLINRSIDLVQENRLGDINAYRSLLMRSEIYDRMGLRSKALHDLKMYSEFKDSLYKAQLQEQIAELSELYESEKKSQKIFEQQQRLEEEKSKRLLQEKELENTQLRNRQIILIFSFSILMLGAVFVILYFKNKQRRLSRLQHEMELREQLFRSQLNPHFVFNSMSVIQSYIYDNNTEKSSEFLVSLSRLMRLILENSAKEMIKLSVELEILKRFLFIQQERFENRFSYEIENLSDLNEDLVVIPPMILQPFLENATEHGELDKVINGKIRITYKREGQLLIFTVEDNGIGRKAAQKKNAKRKNHKSMAISITKKRIELLRQKYNAQGYFNIEDLDEATHRGTRVTIAIPLNTVINEL